MPILGQGGNFLKVDDVKDGDLIEFIDEGTWQESKFSYPDGNPKQDFVIGVKFGEGSYKIRLGKFSRDELIPAYGSDTKEWVGKNAKITIETYRSLNKKGIILSPANGGKTKTIDEVEAIWDE